MTHRDVSISPTTPVRLVLPAGWTNRTVPGVDGETGWCRHVFVGRGWTPVGAV